MKADNPIGEYVEESLLSGKVALRDPRELHPHPMNSLIYGTVVDPGLRADIAANGIQEALIITTDNTIISGHCRYAIAIEFGLPHVPVAVSPLTDPLEIKSAMISSNRRRPKRNYQAAREYQQLKPMQVELAKRRMLAGKALTIDPMANWPQGLTNKKGLARDLAAEMVGMKPKTAERALLVVQAIDRMEAKGCDDEVDNLITHLNKSVLRGYNTAKNLGYISDERLRVAFAKMNNHPWAGWRWDPVTGCRQDCWYCNAHAYAIHSPAMFVDKMASIDEQEQHLAEPFAPRFHQARLNAPFNTKAPFADDPLKSRVLTCWQGELFGPWVSRDWIDQILAVARNSAEQGLPWQYIFVTKYPARLLEIAWPENVWVGATVDEQQRVAEAEAAFRELRSRYPAMTTFAACEPLLEPIQFSSLEMFTRIFIGGAQRSEQCEGSQPEWHWVVSLLAQAARDSCRVMTQPTLRPQWPREDSDDKMEDGEDLATLLRLAVQPVTQQSMTNSYATGARDV